MGVRVIYDEKQNMAAIYCSVVDVVFGPAIYGGNIDAERLAEKFLAWLPCDAREYQNDALIEKWNEFIALEWHECQECADGLVEKGFDACKKCREKCELCGFKGIETKKVKHVVEGSEITERLCADCEKGY